MSGGVCTNPVFAGLIYWNPSVGVSNMRSMACNRTVALKGRVTVIRLVFGTGETLCYVWKMYWMPDALTKCWDILITPFPIVD